MGIYVLLILGLAFVTEALVELIVKSKFFEPVRAFVSRVRFFKELFSCGYCMSFWAALAVITAVPVVVVPFSETHYLNALGTLLIVQRLSNIMHNIIDKWTDKYYDMRYMNSDKE